MARLLLLHAKPQAGEVNSERRGSPERQTQTLAFPLPTLAWGSERQCPTPGGVRARERAERPWPCPGATASHSPCRRSDCPTRLSVLLEWRLPVHACGSNSAGVLGLGRGCLPAARTWGAPIRAGESTESPWFSDWVPRSFRCPEGLSRRGQKNVRGTQGLHCLCSSLCRSPGLQEGLAEGWSGVQLPVPAHAYETVHPKAPGGLLRCGLAGAGSQRRAVGSQPLGQEGEHRVAGGWLGGVGSFLGIRITRLSFLPGGAG